MRDSCFLLHRVQFEMVLVHATQASSSRKRAVTGLLVVHTWRENADAFLSPRSFFKNVRFSMYQGQKVLEIRSMISENFNNKYFWSDEWHD